MRDLHQSGVTKIYSPDDGRTMGLLGMIDHLMGEASTVDLVQDQRIATLSKIVDAGDMAKVGLLHYLNQRMMRHLLIWWRNAVLQAKRCQLLSE